jgi:integrase
VRVPKYRLHKATNRGVVTINQRDIYLGEFNSTESKAKYRRLIAEYCATADPALFGRPKQSIKIVELVVAFLKHSKSKNGTGPNSEYGRQKLALKSLRQLYGDCTPESFSVLQFKALRKHFIDSAGKKLSRRYVNSVMSRVIRMFAWSAGEGLILPSVVEILKAVPNLAEGDSKSLVERDKVQPVSDAIVEATLEHLSQTVGDMVRVQRLIGCRPSELCNLKVANIDRSQEIWVADLVKHKNSRRGKIRKLYFGKTAQAILLKYLFGDGYVFSPKKTEALRREALGKKRVTSLSCGNVVGSNRAKKPMRAPGECYKVGSYGRAIARACLAAKVEQWSPNQLRHALATQVRSEIGIEAASATLGHSNLKTTEVYAKADERLALEVARKLG